MKAFFRIVKALGLVAGIMVALMAVLGSVWNSSAEASAVKLTVDRHTEDIAINRTHHEDLEGQYNRDLTAINLQLAEHNILLRQNNAWLKLLLEREGIPVIDITE